jgi:VCBS repeat-containing protein
VPYTGATQAVDLGLYDLTVNGITVGRGGGSDSTSTAIGYKALFDNTGPLNTAIGFSALSVNQTGLGNTASGAGALYSNTTGDGNTASSYGSLYYNTSGSNNTAIGQSSLAFNTIGSNNTAIGAGALVNSTGESNTAIGYMATVAIDSLTNATAIGAGARVEASNTIQLGADGTNDTTPISNVKTSGTLTAGAVTYPNTLGSSGEVLTIDSNGTVTWAVSTSITEVSDEFTATAAQTTFTISHAKGTNRTIKMYINGIRVSNTAYSDSLTTVTYTSANNGGYTIVAGDRIQFDFSY